MSLANTNRPMRVFEKILGGGLAAGNIGVIMSRHGTGKHAVLTSITLDHAMDSKNTLHVAINQSVSDVRAYDDSVLAEILNSLNVVDRTEALTNVERHKQIYTYRNEQFSAKRLRQTVEFLIEHAEFRPQLIEINGWPDFRTISVEEMKALKGLAVEFDCEVWLSAHTSTDDKVDSRGVPDSISRFDNLLSVMMSLQPDGKAVALRVIKASVQPQKGVNLEFDPTTMLIRWR